MLEIGIIAVGLGLDAFSVAVAFGMCQRVCPLDTRLRLSLSFGLFQFFMPLLGFYAGLWIARFMVNVDHWVVLAVLSFVGGKMIYEAWERDEDETTIDISQGLPLLAVSLATSIDAMAVGFSFALLHKGIFSSALVIGVVALMMTFIGVSFGHQVGKRFISKPEIVGGIAIIGIGLKIFLEHIV